MKEKFMYCRNQMMSVFFCCFFEFVCVWYHRSSIHDHTDSHCFLKLLQGQLKETLFEWPDQKLQGGMVQKSQQILLENQCAYINGKSETVHVANKRTHNVLMY